MSNFGAIDVKIKSKIFDFNTPEFLKIKTLSKP